MRKRLREKGGGTFLSPITLKWGVGKPPLRFFLFTKRSCSGEAGSSEALF